MPSSRTLIIDIATMTSKTAADFYIRLLDGWGGVPCAHVQYCKDMNIWSRTIYITCTYVQIRLGNVLYIDNIYHIVVAVFIFEFFMEITSKLN